VASGLAPGPMTTPPGRRGGSWEIYGTFVNEVFIAKKTLVIFRDGNRSVVPKEAALMYTFLIAGMLKI